MIEGVLLISVVLNIILFSLFNKQDKMIGKLLNRNKILQFKVSSYKYADEEFKED